MDETRWSRKADRDLQNEASRADSPYCRPSRSARGDPLLGRRVPIYQSSFLSSCMDIFLQVWAHHHSPVPYRIDNLASTDLLSD